MAILNQRAGQALSFGRAEGGSPPCADATYPGPRGDGVQGLSRLKTPALIALLWGVVSLGAVRGQPTSSEYQLKAVFLYHFVQFTEWPTNAFSSTNSPVVIGVLGDDPFGRLLEETVRDETPNGRRVTVQRYRRAEDIKECHVLFISRSETKRLGEILAGLGGRTILTVGEAETFAESGGMIGFVVEKNKIRFKINAEAARRANLTLSSKLLRLAVPMART